MSQRVNTKYTFTSDYTANYKADPRPSAEMKTKHYKKGDVINGKSFDSGKTISTNIDGSYPKEGVIGVPFIAIPISVLKEMEFAPQHNRPSSKQQPDFNFQPNPYIIGSGAGIGLLIAGIFCYATEKQGGALFAILITSAIVGGGVGTVVNYTMQLRTDNKNRQ